MQVITRFTHDKVRFDQDNEIHLVTTLKAPKLAAVSKRPAVSVTVACDVSGSMSGDKLAYAKQTLSKLIEHLQPGDYFGLVAFDTSVEVIVTTQEITQFKKEDFKAKVAQMRDRSSTNLSGGLLEALSLANKMDLPENAINRVIVLTDGHPNVGIAITPEALMTTLSANIGKATVSMFGYGKDTNHDLLDQMAKLGKGNFAFIANPDDAVTAFAKELGGLLSTYAQGIRIEIEPQNGHEISDVVSDVDAEELEGKTVITLPDLLSEEERHIVFAVKLTKQKKALPRATTAFNLTTTFSVLDENGKKTEKRETSKALIKLVKPGEEQDKPTPDVDKIVGVSQLVKAQIEAEAAAKRGEYKAAGAILLQQQNSFNARDLTALAGAAHSMQGYLSSDAQAYAASAGLRSAVRSSGTRAYNTSSSNADAQAFYVGTGMSFSNSVQDAVVQSFAGEPQGVVAGVVTASPVAPASEPPKPPASDVPKKKISKKRSNRW